ncbi:MAG: pyrimidine dimer DNA glycosylase/endonuclease V [Methanocella sp.]|jgi:hypothetical protein
MVRIWAVPVGELDRQHLLGEHAELHCIVGALQGKYKAYRRHPETLRFENRIEQLYDRHNHQVQEMTRRGYKHNSPINGAPQPYIYLPEEYWRDHQELLKRQCQTQTTF